MSCACLDPAALAPTGAAAITPEIALDPTISKDSQGLYLSFRDDEPRAWHLWITDPWAQKAPGVGPFAIARAAGQRFLAIVWTAEGELRVGNIAPDTLWRTADPAIRGTTLHFYLQAGQWGVANAALLPLGPSPFRALCPYITDFGAPSLCAKCDPTSPLTCIDFDPTNPRDDLVAVGAVFGGALVLRVLGLI